MKPKARKLIAGIVLHIAIWNLAIWAFVSQVANTSPGENYGIIAGWGLTLYLAGVIETPISAVPWLVIFCMAWEMILRAGANSPLDLPYGVYALTSIGRALVFASPIAINWIVKRLLHWGRRRYEKNLLKDTSMTTF